MRQVYVRIVLSLPDPDPSNIHSQDSTVFDHFWDAAKTLGRIDGIRIDEASTVLLRRD